MKIPALPASSLAALLAPLASASDLTLDGGTSTFVPYGEATQVSLSGLAGAPALVFLDVDPGPIPFEGELVPIGLSPLFTLLYSTIIPASGTSTIGFPIPVNANLAGQSFYIAGLIADPSDPNGLDFSNNAVLNVVPPGGAGPDLTTFTGREVALDGSGASDPSGSLPAGTGVLWELTSQPVGSTAALGLADTMFPVFTPDVHGEYVARYTVTAGGSSSQDTMSVHAYELQHTSQFDGKWLPVPIFVVLGNIQGPSLGSLRVNGVDVAVGPGGDFGPINEAFVAGEIFHPVTIEVVDADGTAVREQLTAGQGSPGSLGNNAPKALAAHLNQGGIDQIEAAAAGQVASIDVQGLLQSLGVQELANDEGLFGITLFSAYLQFKTLSFNQNDVTVQLTPGTGGLHGFVSLKNVLVTFDVWGEILEIDYSLTGSMTTNPVEISGNLTLGASGGEMTAGISNVNVVRHNFNFNLDGFLGSIGELFVVESEVKADVEAAIAQTVATELPAAVAALLNEFQISGNLYDVLSVDVQVEAPISGIVHTSSGVTIQLDTNSTVGVPEPGSPSVQTYRQTTSAAPSFGVTTPAGGLPYGAALATADDFLNQVLAAATGAGLLNGDPTTLLDPGKGKGDPTELLFTDALATLFPGAGFEKFPSGTPVSLFASGTMPPVVSTTPGGESQSVIQITDLVLDFSIPVEGGSIPMLSVAMGGSAGMDLSIESDGTLLANVGELTMEATALRGFPGSDLSLIQAGIDFLAEFLLPSLTEGLEGIPLPELELEGLGVSPTEITLTGGGLQYVGFYGDLVLTNPAP